MQSPDRKPQHHPASRPATRPVDTHDASALQERLAALEAQVKELRARQTESPAQFADLEAQLDKAVRTRRLVQQKMVELRGQALLARRDDPTQFDHQHPAQELPPGVLVELIRPSVAQTETSTSPSSFTGGGLTLDDHLGSTTEIGSRVANLLEQASNAFMGDTPSAAPGGLQLSTGETVAPISLDFGPLIEDGEPAAPAPVSPKQKAPEPAPAPALRTPPTPSSPTCKAATTAKEPAAPGRPVTPTPRPVAQKTPVAPKTAALQNNVATQTPTTAAPTLQPQPEPSPPSRRILGPGLVAGAILGAAGMIGLTQFPLAGTPPAAATRIPAAAASQTPRQQDSQAALRQGLIQREQDVRSAAHRRFEALRDTGQAAPGAQ